MSDANEAAPVAAGSRLGAMLTDALFGVAKTTFVAGIAFIFVLAVILVVHGNVRDALTALVQGAFGDKYAWANTILKAIPLLLTGLGVAIAFRARMWNIGGQGQFVMGALAASYLAVTCPVTRDLHAASLLPLMMLAAGAAGALWAGLAGVLKTARNVPEVISTIMLNFISLQFLSYLASGPLRRNDGSNLPFTQLLGPSATLSTIASTSTIHDGLYIAMGVVVVVWLLLERSSLGFSIKAVGAAPEAARLAGHPVARTVVSAMLWSGALCGLAGAIELSGVLGYLANDYKPDYGFTAVAVALLGRLNVPGVVLSALLFGALSAGSANMERNANIAHEVGYVVQAVLLLAFLIAPKIGAGWGKRLVRGRTGAAHAE